MDDWFQQRAVPDLDEREVVERVISKQNGELRCPAGRRIPSSPRDGLSSPPGSGRSLGAAGRVLANLAGRALHHTPLPTPRPRRFQGTFGCRSSAAVRARSSRLHFCASPARRPRVHTYAERIVCSGRRAGFIQKKLGRDKVRSSTRRPTSARSASAASSQCRPCSTEVPTAPARYKSSPRRSIRKCMAGAWLVPRLESKYVPLRSTDRRCRRYRTGIRREAHPRTTARTLRYEDHLLCGTGYKVDIARYGFLAPELVWRIVKTERAATRYSRRVLQSSVRRSPFHSAHPPSWSFGPILRFVSGSWFATASLTRAIITMRKAR